MLHEIPHLFIKWTSASADFGIHSKSGNQRTTVQFQAFQIEILAIFFHQTTATDGYFTPGTIYITLVTLGISSTLRAKSETQIIFIKLFFKRKNLELKYQWLSEYAV